MRQEVHLRTSNGRKSIIIDSAFCQTLSALAKGNENIAILFISSWISLLSDSPLNATKKPFKTYITFLHKIRDSGIKSVVLQFSDLAHKLVSQHSLMGSGTSIGDWIDEFKDTPVFFEYINYFRTGDIKLLEYLYTFLNFGKKLDYVDDSFNSTAFRSWLDVENGLIDLDLPDSICLSLKNILNLVLPTYSWTDLRPKFGPGSVQERGVCGRIGKLRNFLYDPIIDRFLLHGHIGMYGLGEDYGVSYEKIIPDPTMWHQGSRISSRIARLKFVPKNLRTSRSICMEPSTLMFFQQAVMQEVLLLIKQSPLYRFIDIKDQTRNQQFALFGSYTSEIDTIDLSAASDSLSLDLVKKVFPPSWLIPMIATRSHSVISPDGIIPIKKFAPMGSSLCFPTQCIIFASVCILAACIYTSDVESRGYSLEDVIPISFIEYTMQEKILHGLSYKVNGLNPFCVYGDDICLDRRLTDIVTSILTSLGFTVNKEKSFTGSQSFRESCGKYYLDGHDITPLYFRVRGVKQRLAASHVASQVKLINACYERGYKNLYRFLRQSLMTWESSHRFRDKGSDYNSIPYVSDSNQFGILCSSPVNSHLRKRYNTDYQRDEVRSLTISYDWKVQPGVSLHLVDSYEYMRWWSGRNNGNSLEVNSSIRRYDTGGPGVRWSWIPAH